LLLLKVGEFATSHALVVDAKIKILPSILSSTRVRCFRKGCQGLVKSAKSPEGKKFTFIARNAKRKD